MEKSAEKTRAYNEWTKKIAAKKAKVRFLSSKINFTGKKVLDVGCGNGIITSEIAKRAAEVVGADINEKLLDEARKAAKGLARFIKADATALPFSDASFDIVTMFHVFHNIPKEGRKNAIAEARRVLRSGGLFVITDLAPAGDMYKIRKHSGRPHHFNIGEEIKERLQEFNFKKVKSEIYEAVFKYKDADEAFYYTVTVFYDDFSVSDRAFLHKYLKKHGPAVSQPGMLITARKG